MVTEQISKCVYVVNGARFFIDGFLKKNLDICKETIKKDWDMLFCIDGPEGSGKSVLAMQIAKYLDENFNIEHIAFTPDEFMEKVIAAKQYSVVLFDEAYSGLSSRSAMGKTNKVIVKMLAEIRQKNLFILIVLPSFFDLDRYVAVWRSRVLIHTYTGYKFERGHFKFYNMKKKNYMYNYGKKFYNYNCTKPNFFATFTNAYTIDEVEYRKRKLKATQISYKERLCKDEQGLELGEKRARVKVMLHIMEIHPDYSTADIAEIIGVENNTIVTYLNELRLAMVSNTPNPLYYKLLNRIPIKHKFFSESYVKRYILPNNNRKNFNNENALADNLQLNVNENKLFLEKFIKQK